VPTRGEPSLVAAVDSAARDELSQTSSLNWFPRCSCSETKGQGWTSFGLQTGPLKCVTALRPRHALTQPEKRQDCADDDDCPDDIDDGVHEFAFRVRSGIKSRVKRNATPIHTDVDDTLAGQGALCASAHSLQ
jgi:hypothetical protein